MRIGLLAMSGIRVCDAELLRMGLTLPGFVERSKTIASLPSLGLLTLAGATPSNHETVYMEVPDPRELDPLPAGFDLFAISTYTAQALEAYELADRIRATGTPVVIGGPHVTVLPDEAGAHCDAVVIGEGEPVWTELVADAEAGSLRPVYDGRERGFDLADAPVPAFEKLDIDLYNRLTVQTSRGCVHHCDFCAGSILLTPGYKQKPVQGVLAEINRIFEIWDNPFIEFADDNSFVNREYWRELLPQMSKRRFRWFTETDISVAEDDELLDLMHGAGCAQILVGLESPTQPALQGLELNNDWKFRRWAKYRDAIRRIQDHGITVNGCFVIGLDGHTPEIFDQVYEFVRDSELYEVQVTLLTPFPGTPLYARLKAEGRLIEDGRWDMCTLFDVNFHPLAMEPQELTAGFRELVQKLYGEEFTNRRRKRFRQRLRESKQRS